MKFACAFACPSPLRLLLFAGGLLLWNLSCAPVDAASVSQWRQDIDRVVADVRVTHPNPFGRIGETRFLRDVETLKNDLPRLSEEQRMVGAMRLVASIGDGHTQLTPRNSAFARWYPVRIYAFEEGYFITGAHSSTADLAGAELLEVGGRPAAEAIEAARDLMGADNESDRRRRLYAFHNAALMIGLGFARPDGTLHLRLRLPNGRTVERRIAPVTGQTSDFEWISRPEYWGAVGPPEEWVSAYRGQTVARLRVLDESRPLHLRFRRAFYGAHVPADRLYYIQVNIMGGTADESLPAFFRRQLLEVDRVRPQHLVLDLRFNFGGDGSLALPILHEFIARKRNPPWGSFYLLTGRRTFSAGLDLTADLIKHMQPTVIGEPAGAGYLSYGDAQTFSYPDAGISLSVSYLRHQHTTSRELSPIVPVDVPARFTFADYAAGRDPAMEAILRADARSVGTIAAAEGASSAFAIYESRRARFAADPGWRPAPEIDLRRLMLELVDQDRRNEAIQVAMLNTRINPNEWRTWMNLGDLQMRAGQADAAIESYRSSLALNDPTNFNTERLQRLVREQEARRQAPRPAGSR